MKLIFYLFLVCVGKALHAQSPKSAVIRPDNGRPTLFVNGVAQTPTFYALTHAYGGRWSWEEVPARNLNNFCQIGFRLFQVDLWLEDIWAKNSDTLDIRKAQRQVRGVLDQCADASVVIRIHVNAPFWWNKANPDECTQFADAPVDTTLKAGPPYHNEEHDIHAALRASLASAKWKQESGEKLAELCRKLAKTPEGNAVIGMHVAGGIYGEWHYWGFIEHDPDTGPAMTSYFRNWLRAKYKTTKNLQKSWQTKGFTLDNATVPTTVERLRTQDGFFKDPVQEQRTIDYFNAQQQVVADDAIYFCRLVKETWPRPIVTGIFYGYLHMTFNRQTVGGHLFIRQILDSPYIDYLSAPQTYWPDSRKAGGSGNSRGIIESTLLHGKLWLDEIDNGYLHAKNDFENIRYTERYDSTYANIIRRCALLPLMRGIGYWFYDFGPQKGFGWWDNPKYLASMKEEKQFFEKRLSIPYHSEADVLYVWSQDVFYYLKSAPLPITVNVLDQSIEQALRSGTVGDQVYDFDLDRLNLDQYKAVVFMNVYKLTDTQRKFIMEKVAKNGRTIVWNYLTGYTNGNRLDLNFVKSLTGMNLERAHGNQIPIVKFLKPSYTYKFSGIVEPLLIVNDKTTQTLAELDDTGQAIIARKQGEEYTSVFCALPLNGTDGFREVFRQAGCHIYNEQNDFTYANSGLLLLHTKEGGLRTIRLKNGKSVSFSLKQGTNLLLNVTTGEVVLR
ncbi:hypothetical protein [Spirosoma endbachense]|uniref:Glycoside hydrolase family 42 N-terminal domain-containing protein n=1 Tax=Spirosoma endbachense TaxID=2666025 RepID=A0A6P1VTI7_9BACT|nr:hypothetical protein [Spirosoma endbachense]QHV96005.1 hypothetical protein GJR95_13735 [Spirosoma endbachense]